MHIYTTDKLFVGDLRQLLSVTNKDMLKEHFLNPLIASESTMRGYGILYTLGEGQAEVFLNGDCTRSVSKPSRADSGIEILKSPDQYFSCSSNCINLCDLIALMKVHDSQDIDVQIEKNKIIEIPMSNGLYHVSSEMSLCRTSDNLAAARDYLPSNVRKQHRELLDKVRRGESTYADISSEGASLLAQRIHFTLNIELNISIVTDIPVGYRPNVSECTIDWQSLDLDRLFNSSDTK